MKFGYGVEKEMYFQDTKREIILSSPNFPKILPQIDQ